MRVRMRFAVRLLACLLLAGAATGEARAQAPVHYRINANGWVFDPAVVDGYVFGFLCWANTTDPTEDTITTTGDNIKVMWLQRDGTSTWSSWAWGSAGVNEAAQWIRQLLVSSQPFANDAQLAAGIYNNPVTSPAAPKEVTNGLFFDDPVQDALAAAPDAEAFVTALSDMGYKAAPVLSSQLLRLATRRRATRSPR